MHQIGSRAYARNHDLRKADKTESRTLIVHLVGYQGMNIYHIWLPTKDDIFVTRDIIFEPGRFYTGDNKYSPESMIEEVIEVLEYPILSRDKDIEINEL